MPRTVTGVAPSRGPNCRAYSGTRGQSVCQSRGPTGLRGSGISGRCGSVFGEFRVGGIMGCRTASLCGGGFCVRIGSSLQCGRHLGSVGCVWIIIPASPPSPDSVEFSGR
ncbi:hypothetical protein M758_3G262300 [Ceratodon purpureus]|nr:hypothetical protein M758_3G262300 [Ceratodon purpureus]